MNLPKALVLTVAATTFCLMTSPAFAVEETTPQNMTCQEFMDMNPKSMTPVAFWVVNRNTDFSGGDYVDWHEVETVSVPKMLQECHKNPHSHGRWRPISLRYKNAPIIAPTTGASSGTRK